MKKDEKPEYTPDPLAVPYDCRNRFTGKYSMSFKMQSSDNHYQPTRWYNGDTNVICTVRLAIPQDSVTKGMARYTDSTLILTGIPFLDEENGGVYQLEYNSPVTPSGVGGIMGFFWLQFRNDSLLLQGSAGCYQKYYSCSTYGRGKRIPWLFLFRAPFFIV